MVSALYGTLLLFIFKLHLFNIMNVKISLIGSVKSGIKHHSLAMQSGLVDGVKTRL
jgi:hypothetical protein